MVREGYKQTEVGILPNDWEIMPLKSIVKGNLTYGINAAAVPYLSTLPQYLRITDITEDGKYCKDDKVSVDANDVDNFWMNLGDIVFARTGASTGKSYLYREADGKMVYAGFLIKASIDPEKANPGFVFNQFRTARYWNWVGMTSQRSGQPGINGKEYGSYEIVLPKRYEQDAIAKALSDIDELINNLEKLIEKKKYIKHGAMQELLSGKKRLPGFAGRWIDMEIGKCGYLQKGSINPQLNPTVVFSEYSMPAFDENKKPSKTKGIDMHSNRTIINGKVLLFNKLNVRQKRIWLIEQTEENAVCSSEFLPYCSEVIDLQLLSQILFTDEVTTDFIGMSTGTSNSQKRITPAAFLEYSVYLPEDLEEQKALARVFTDMDREIELYEVKVNKYRNLKQGMMQKLLTGEIRLV